MIEPVCEAKLVRKGGFLVVKFPKARRKMTHAEVNRVLRGIREGRRCGDAVRPFKDRS